MRLLSFALVISVFFRRTFSCVFNAEYDVIYESTKCGSFSLCTVPDRYPSRGCSLFVQIADQHLCLTHSICFFIILSLSPALHLLNRATQLHPSPPPPPDVFLRPSNWTASAWQSLFLLTRAAPSSYYLFFFLFLHSSFFCRVFPSCLYVSHTLNEGEWCDALFPVSPPIVFRVPNSFSSRHSIIWLDEWRNRKEVYSESSDYLDKLRIGIVLYDVGRSDPYFWANAVAAL